MRKPPKVIYVVVKDEALVAFHGTSEARKLAKQWRTGPPVVYVPRVGKVARVKLVPYWYCMLCQRHHRLAKCPARKVGKGKEGR